LSDRALDNDSAAVGFDDVFDDAQADSNALGLAAQFRATTIKPLEDALVFLGRDAFAVVGDGEEEGSVLRVACFSSLSVR